jgi:hypothetical protein
MTHTAGNCLPILLTLSVSFASAAQVYTWVDDSGITHFSETPPAERAAEILLIDIAPAPAGTDSAGDDFYSVINQAKRMEARRLENEKLDAEKKQASAEASRARAEADAIQQGSYNDSAADDIRYYPAYPAYPYYPHYGHHPGRPGYGPRPEHPVYPGYARPRNPRTSLGKTHGMPGQTGAWR